MRLYAAAIIGLLTISSAFCSQPDSEESTTSATVKEYDQQIALLKQQIEKYTLLANQFDRKATQLRSRDFSGCRQTCEIRDRCREIAADLQKHLEKLEKQETELVQAEQKGSGG